MLTRSQVARRLGKSVATVRRLEGVELHPRRDWRGVWRFGEAEVDALRRKVEAGFRPPVALTAPRKQAAEIAALERRVGQLEDLLAALLTDG